MLDPKENRKIWMKYAEESKDLLEGRAADAIEKYRKGWCKLRFVDMEGKPIAGKKVTVNQATHDFKYGANIFMLDEFQSPEDNAAYRENFKKYFNLATVPFYWDGLEPTEGKPRFAKDSEKVYRRPAPELCVEYCEESGIDAKLHCLVYENFVPDWLPKSDMVAMEKKYEERFRQISERFSGRMLEFEVINELLCEHGWTKQSVISKKHDIIEWSFDLARKYFPNETLVINEGNPIIDGAWKGYRAPYVLLVENALLKGVEIDKIGLQHHDFCGVTATTDEAYEKSVMNGGKMFCPQRLFKGLDVFAEFGLPLELTEITIPTFGETEEDEELQADLLEVLYTVCFGHPAVDTVVYWNVPDGYAYAAQGRNWNENQCRGGLWHHDLTPKKSAERLWELFNKKWHTDLELTTDENGYVEFRGFYGDYTAEIDDSVADFGIHKNTDNCIEIEI